MCKSNKAFSFLCDPGPGDALRFIHSFCEYINCNNKLGIVYCLPEAWKKCNLLINKCNKNCGKGITTQLVDSVDKLNDILANIKCEYIFHAFETNWFIPNTKIFPKQITKNIKADFVQMDRYCNQYYMRNKFSDHLTLPFVSDLNSKTGIIFVRITNIVPERNLTSNILEAIINNVSSNNLQYVFSGSSLPKEFYKIVDSNDVEELFPNEKYPDYYNQICEYSKYSYAVGMNSGALDLAAASGIKIIRIGEYHHHLSHQGKHYNDFLINNTTINILSNSEYDISNINNYSINQAFNYLIKIKNARLINIQ